MGNSADLLKSLKSDSRCEDIQIFLKQLRVIDDKIIYGLNLATPTDSFRKSVDPSRRCEDLFSQLKENYQHRSDLIQGCLNTASGNIADIQGQDIPNKNEIKLQRSKMRELRNEMGVEEILKMRGKKVFTEKCSSHYRGYEDW